MEILDLLNEEIVSGVSSGKLAFKFDENPTANFLKGELIAKKMIQTVFFNTDFFTPLAHEHGKKKDQNLIQIKVPAETVSLS